MSMARKFYNQNYLLDHKAPTLVNYSFGNSWIYPIPLLDISSPSGINAINDIANTQWLFVGYRKIPNPHEVDILKHWILRGLPSKILCFRISTEWGLGIFRYPIKSHCVFGFSHTKHKNQTKCKQKQSRTFMMTY